MKESLLKDLHANVKAHPYFYLDMTVVYLSRMLKVHNESMEPLIRGCGSLYNMLSILEGTIDKGVESTCRLLEKELQSLIDNHLQAIHDIAKRIELVKMALPEGAIDQENLDKMHAFTDKIRDSMM